MRIMRLAAIIINAIESWLFAGIKTEVDEFEKGISTVKITYYFEVKATRYNKNGISRITIPTSITVDGNCYDKHHAERLALEVFKDLSDAWILRAEPINYAVYQFRRDHFNREIERMFGINAGSAEPTTETNS